MEQQKKTKTILAVVIVLLLLAIGYVLSTKDRSPNQDNSATSGEDNGSFATVVVENTSAVDGALPTPAGFPEDIPIETGNILESASTKYPDQNAEQLSLSYTSSKTVAEKYTEYKTYMTQASYDVTEGDASSPLKALFGTKTEANLSVVISSSEEGLTLVQLSYLLKSGQ